MKGAADLVYQVQRRSRSVAHNISRVKSVAGEHGNPALEFESDEVRQKELWSEMKEAL